jgi:hypothetical protein
MWIVLSLGLCAFAGLGRLADGAQGLHAAGYQTPWFPGGLLGCLCLALPATAGGVLLGFLRGRRPPAVTAEDWRALGEASASEMP